MNVLGTAEAIKFALRAGLARVEFVSTVALHPYLDMPQGNSEAAPLKARIKITDHYAAGYGASKWAG